MLVALTANAQSCPDNNHPHMIDLGLPSGTKWACCNVDTEHPEKQSPTNYGGYYAWGETEVKDVYNAVTYQYASGVDDDGNGYYNDWHDDTGCYGVWQDLGSDIAGTQYDVAHVKWGGSWMMPSLGQINELLVNCTYKWTTVNGVDGGQFTGSNGSCIFLPVAGYRWNDDLYDADGRGIYWSSTRHLSNSNDAYYLSFLSGGANWYYGYHRDLGPTVRPVSK